jgi:hypothetical protein
MDKIDLASLLSDFSIQRLKTLYSDARFRESLEELAKGNESIIIDDIEYSLLKSQDFEPSSQFIAEIFSEEIPSYKWLNISPRENLLGWIYGWCHKGNWELCSVIAKHNGELIGALQALDSSTAPDYPQIPDEVAEYRDKEYLLWKCCELCTPGWVKDYKAMSDTMIAVKTNTGGRGIGGKMLALSMCLAVYHGYEYYSVYCLSDPSIKMHSRYMEMYDEVKFEDIERDGERRYIGCPGGFRFGWVKMNP